MECYLWRSLVHPFNSRRRWARPLEDAMFGWYARHPPPVLRRWIAEADVIVFESGTAIAFIELTRRLNPAARLVYRASDALSAIDVAAWITRTFDRVAPMLDAIALVSPAMAGEIASTGNVFHVGHGIDHGLAVPAVCPHAVVGGRGSRHGYTPGDADSLLAAVAHALEAPRAPARRWLDWAQTTDRVLDPARFPDTRIAVAEHGR